MIFAILFGGQSYEHEVSIVGAISLKKAINKPLVFIFCDENRDFYLIEPQNMKAQYFSSKKFLKNPKLMLKKNGFSQKALFKEVEVKFDVIINLIHGRDGEDGKVSALFDFFDIPYIGPRLEASALSYNKVLTKYFAKMVNVKTLPFEVITRENNIINTELPFIIKPLRLGSSIGVSVVRNKEDIEYAKDVAFEYDYELLIEPFIENIKEINLAGYMSGDKIIYSIIEEPKKKEMLDFEQKYMDFSRTSQVLSADLSKEEEEATRESFAKIYNPKFKGALIRCDFFILEGEIYLNEINPNPGSLANYLFSDFTKTVEDLAKSLPSENNIKINYDYIMSINCAKGKT